MTSLEQFNAIFRNLKWIIAISLLISGILFFPDQIRELYRISADNEGVATPSIEFISIAVIAISIWIGAIQLAAQTLKSSGPLQGLPAFTLRYLPAALGSLPVFTAALAQFFSKPDLTLPGLQWLNVGSVFRIQNEALQIINDRLSTHGWILLSVACAIAAITSMLNDRVLPLSTKANASYFIRNQFLVATVAVVAAITAIIVLIPVFLPQMLGTFGILAVFTLCLTAICIHLSLLTITHRIPFIPIIMLFGLIIAYFDWNDDHFIRTLPLSSAAPISTPPARITAGDAFIEWLRQRVPQASAAGITAGPNPGANASKYPVFIVTAQGGGIYAAYNAAMFLARMQDLCPDFHNHVFAISSVSGGSVGAATFAAALDTGHMTGPKLQSSIDDPCPQVTKFLSNARVDEKLDEAGPLEQKVAAALASDFLSPLVAATLFPDFTQSIIPYPLGFLDRARALEYALENSTDRMYPNTSPGGAAKAQNLLKKNYQDYWNPNGAIPALLMNATNSGRGKRVVIAPFDLSKSNSPSSDVCILATSNNSVRFSISTAAFVSARFPWVTPAASTDVTNSCINKKPFKKVRLVDGGYIDNSGVETALDLIDEIEVAVEAENENAKTDPSRTLPEIGIYLISLSGGDFPDNREFSFNELMEPIRALLNGREARAYIALNRAKTDLNIAAVIGPTRPELPRFNRTDLQNYFYSLPLGWAMSDRTRDIIALESGRFWDCVPDRDFSQSKEHLSNADCVQLQVYHLLNNSARTALDGVEEARKTVEKIAKLTAGDDKPPRLDHETLLACYERDWWQKQYFESRQRAFERAHRRWEAETKNQTNSAGLVEPKPPDPSRKRYLAFYQAEHVRELLREWDRLTSLTEPDFLAYVLGSISYDSDDFRRTTENLTYKSVGQINGSHWKARIARVDDTRRKENPPLPPVDLSTLTNSPEHFAEVVWGWKGNWFGNNSRNGEYDPEMKDGWNFRARGVYQKVGREQFEEASRWLAGTSPIFDKKMLLDEPNALWNRTVSARVAFAHFINSKSPPDTGATDPPIQRRRELGLFSKTLADVLKEHPGDFKSARLNQVDLAGDDEDVVMVEARSKLFRDCIGQARFKP